MVIVVIDHVMMSWHQAHYVFDPDDIDQVLLLCGGCGELVCNDASSRPIRRPPRYDHCHTCSCVSGDMMMIMMMMMMMVMMVI